MKNPALDRTVCTIISFIIFVLVFRASFYLNQAPFLHDVLSILRFISWGLFLMLFFHSPQKIDGLGFWLITYAGLIGYSTIVHSSDAPFTVISVGFDILMLWGICKLFLPTYGQFILRTLSIARSFCVYLNFILLFIYPEGVWITPGGNGYFLLGGNYNQMGRTIIPAITITGFYRLRYNQMHINFPFLIVCSTLTLLYVGSKTSLVGIVLLIAFYFIKSYRARKWLLISFIIVYGLFQYLAVFAQQDFSKNEYVVYFVEGVLKKDLTFTNRTEVWLKSITLFEESPIIGYGYQTDEWYTSHMGVTTAHNLILNQLVSGGIVGLSLFVILIFISVKQHLKSPFPASQFLFFGLCSFLFMMIMEVYPLTYIILLLILLYNSEQFAPEQEPTIEKQNI